MYTPTYTGTLTSTPKVTEDEQPFHVISLPITAPNSRTSRVAEICSPIHNKEKFHHKPVCDSSPRSEGKPLPPPSLENH